MIELPSRARKIAMLGGAGCTLIGGIVLWKESISGQKLEYEKTNKEIQTKIENKVFVVTGANSGIGRETVHELAKRKGRVYMACRDLRKCEEERKEIVLDTKNKYVYCRECDLGSLESIRSFVSSLQAKEGKVDVLINNAGVMKCRKMATLDGIEAQLGTNHMGPLLLTWLLRPSLAAEGGGRVLYLMDLDYRKGEINLEDLNSDKEYDPGEAFNQSQLANMLTTTNLAEQWRVDNVTINAVYPGVCSTNIKRHMGVDRSITGNIIANPLLWLLTRTASRGAQGVIWAATDSSLDRMTGKLFSSMQEIEIDSKARDKVLSEKMLAVSKFWTGLENNKSAMISR